MSPVSQQYSSDIQAKIDQKTKPLGALGAIEKLAAKLANIQAQRNGQWQQLDKLTPRVIVFAGDHGIAAKGVSIAPSDVTFQMVVNFLNGGAAINCFCRCHNIDFQVVDTGMCTPLPAELQAQHHNFIESRVGAGTHDLSEQSAMTLAQVDACVAAGEKISLQAIEQGCNLFMFGEMGIANTSAASAITAAVLGLSAQESVGLGTGITQAQLNLKKQLIQRGLDRLSLNEKKHQAYTQLAELGGFEIAHIVGAMLASSKQGVPILVDGFIVSAAALLAEKLAPNIRDYLIFAHQSDEFAHQRILANFNAHPLLKLDLRLGEGTGAALAYPLLQAAMSFYNDMASFESAGVTV